MTRDLILVFDAPDDATGLALKIPAGTFSFGQDATLKMPDADQ